MSVGSLNFGNNDRSNCVLAACTKIASMGYSLSGRNLRWVYVARPYKVRKRWDERTDERQTVALWHAYR